MDGVNEVNLVSVDGRDVSERRGDCGGILFNKESISPN